MQHFNRSARHSPASVRRCLAALMLFSSLGAAGAQGADTLTRDGLAPQDPAVAAALPRYLGSRSASFVDWLADGSMLVATRFGETEQVHRLRAPLGMREQLSFAAQGVLSAAARPYGSDALAYLEPHPGAGATQLFLQRIDTHLVSALTDGSHRDGAPFWAHDGKRIAFTSNRRNGHDADIYLLDAESETGNAVPRLLAGGMGYSWRIYDWSVDDRRLLIGRARPGAADDTDSAENELYVADVAAGEITPVTLTTGSTGAAGGRAKRGQKIAPSPLPALARAARFAPDGRGIVLLTHQTGAAAGADDTAAQFLHLSYTDPISHEWRNLTPADGHDVEHFDSSVDGHYLAYTFNDRGLSRLVLIDQQRKLELAANELPEGIISDLKFDLSAKHLALTIESARSPRDVYVFEPDTHALTQWTKSELGAVNAQALVQPERLQFPTWDRVDGQARQLSALVYRAANQPAAPAGAAADGPRPVLILLCSGGGTQCRPQFDPFLQYLVNELGFVVVAPDVRGSAGYGRNFEALGEESLREDAVRDIGSLLVWIGVQHELDRNRVALLGEGYGSYLALESLAEYGDRLRGAVVAFAPSLPPLVNVDSIVRPLLLVQGLNNPAMPAYQLEQLRGRLRVNHVEVQYLAAADEAQNFLRQSDRDAYRVAAANFLASLTR